MYQSRFPALELEHNVKIVLPRVVYSTDRSVFVVVQGNVPAAVVAVKNHLYKLLSECMGGITTNLDKLPPSPDATTCTNHVFVDNSNLYWGCQDADSPDTKVQVSFRKVSAWVEGGRPTATRFVSGTMPSPVEEKWRQLGDTVLSSASDAGACRGGLRGRGDRALRVVQQRLGKDVGAAQGGPRRFAGGLLPGA